MHFSIFPQKSHLSGISRSILRCISQSSPVFLASRHITQISSIIKNSEISSSAIFFDSAFIISLISGENSKSQPLFSLIYCETAAELMPSLQAICFWVNLSSFNAFASSDLIAGRRHQTTNSQGDFNFILN